MKGFTKEDSSRIGFATSCLFYEALDLAEMHQWILRLMEEPTSSPPTYLVDLLEFSAPLSHIYKVIGFVPHWPHPDDAKEALFGIAFKRGRQPYDCPIDRETAIRKLKQYPRVEATFRTEFPFIEFK